MRYSFTQSKKGWFKNHINDPFVKKAQAMSIRSRAGFKLEEIEKKYRILGDKTLDIGSAPGSWCEMALKIRPDTKIVAVDILQVRKCLEEGDEGY